MLQKKIYKSIPRFKVGDKVKFMYVEIPVVTVVAEDRGNLGARGQRVYGLWYSLPDSDREYIELPEEKLEPVS